MSTTLLPTNDSPSQATIDQPSGEDLDQVELMVELGHTRLTRAEVQQLQPGAMICLDEYLQDPVTIYSGTKLVGRGEVLLIEGQLGVRVTELYQSQLDR